MYTTFYKGDRFENGNIFDVRTHFKPAETFQYTHFTSLRPGLKKGFVKGEAQTLQTLQELILEAR